MRNKTYAMIRHGVVRGDRTEYKNVREMEHEFSEDFKAKLTIIAKTECKHCQVYSTQRFSFKNVGKKIGIAVLAASIAITSSVSMLADAPKDPDFTIEMTTRSSFDDTIEISFINGVVKGTQTFEVMLDYHSPSFIPEGYKIIEDVKSDQYRYIRYESTDPELRKNWDTQITFSQDNLCGNPSINSGNCYLDSININGGEGMISIRNDDHTGAIVWSDGIYMYTITGDFDEANLVKLAKSVQSDENNFF